MRGSHGFFHLIFTNNPVKDISLRNNDLPSGYPVSFWAEQGHSPRSLWAESCTLHYMVPENVLHFVIYCNFFLKKIKSSDFIHSGKTTTTKESVPFFEVNILPSQGMHYFGWGHGCQPPWPPLFPTT